MKIAIGLVVVATTLILAGQARADGKDVYAANCGMCHNNISPKLGDKTAWAPLIAKGTPALTESTVKGKGAMPPKGGKPALSDADIQSAVEYIVSQSQ